MSEPLVQPVSARSLLEDVRQLVREKNGLNISLSDPAGSSLTPVKHRVQALEHTPGKSHTTPTAVPKSQALSHSSSASWKQLHLETGKSAWQREEKSGVRLHLPSSCKRKTIDHSVDFEK